MAEKPFTMKVKTESGYDNMYPKTLAEQVITNKDNRFISDGEKAQISETATILRGYQNSGAGFNYIINPLSETVSIWRRGIVFGGIATWKAYCADKWFYVNPGADYTFSKDTDGSIKMVSPTKPVSHGAVCQSIENGIIFIRKRATLSFKIKTNSKIECYLQGLDSSGVAVYSHGITVVNTNSVYKQYSHTTSVIPDMVASLTATFFVFADYPTDAVTVNVKNVKVEIGDTATPFISPDPALELLKCQRYYGKAAFQCVAIPSSSGAGTLFFAYDFNNLRTVPTVTVIDGAVWAPEGRILSANNIILPTFGRIGHGEAKFSGVDSQIAGAAGAGIINVIYDAEMY